MTLTALVVVVLAVTAALVYNRVAWRPRQASGRTSDDGLSIAGIIGPLGTLSVLLLVFVLVQTYASWSAVGEAETAIVEVARASMVVMGTVPAFEA